MAVSPEQEAADIPVVAVDTPAPVAEQAWVVAVDPDAFIVVQEAHQVLGEGFARYSKDSL